MSASRLADVLGFLGAVIILAAFARQTISGTAPDRLYHLGNFAGAALLAASLLVNYNLPALLLELAWAGIALFGLFKWKSAP